MVERLDAVTSFVDLRHQGRPRAIGTGVLELDDGIALVDPGPTACLGELRARLETLDHALPDVRAILLTHIHLDHATAAGAIIREAPHAIVCVHPRGAEHMVDPTRLLASARRLYGDAMDALWGEFVPVPAAAVRRVDEGDQVTLGRRSLTVAYTPGHAKHHVAYFEESAGTAWVGDVGGIRIPPGVTVPVTPPPDIDLAAWNDSMDRVLAWRPHRIVPTHFGPSEDPGRHFEELRAGLARWAEVVRESLRGDAGHGPDPARDASRAKRFADWLEEDLRSRMPPEHVDAYTGAFGFEDSWWGLARYWRKRV